jgi:hypothetical protein
MSAQGLRCGGCGLGAVSLGMRTMSGPLPAALFLSTKSSTCEVVDGIWELQSPESRTQCCDDVRGEKCMSISRG